MVRVQSTIGGGKKSRDLIVNFASTRVIVVRRQKNVFRNLGKIPIKTSELLNNEHAGNVSKLLRAFDN